MNLLAGAVAALLLGSTAAAPAPEPRAWVPGEHGSASIRMSIVNWGQDVDLSGTAAAYAHLGANGPSTKVRVDITPPSSGMHGFYGRLTAPDAFGGELVLYCGDEYRRIDSVQRCFFEVPMTRGINHLTFDLQSASWKGIISEEGVVHGASVGMSAVLEAALPYGNWAKVPADDALALRGEQTSELRYRIQNTGDMPFRAPGSCLPDGTVWQYQQLVCTVRSLRPVYALAGDYAVPIVLADPVGGGASFSIEGHLVARNATSVRPNAASTPRLSGSHG
jgi:hypothetical protein